MREFCVVLWEFLLRELEIFFCQVFLVCARIFLVSDKFWVCKTFFGVCQTFFVGWEFFESVGGFCHFFSDWEIWCFDSFLGGWFFGGWVWEFFFFSRWVRDFRSMWEFFVTRDFSVSIIIVIIIIRRRIFRCNIVIYFHKNAFRVWFSNRWIFFLNYQLST